MRDYRILAAVVFAALLGRYCDAASITNKPTQLFSFSGGVDGGMPQAGLIQAIDGNFYGTTSQGGTSNTGTLFKITSAGTLTTLYSFTAGADGATPEAELVQGSDGFFYGTALLGGSNNNGTVFQISSNGVFTALHDFSGVDGAMPLSTLVEGSDGNFYGTTSHGGASNTGTVFTITSAGTLTTLYSFTGAGVDGAIPKSGLVQGTNGLFYGTTYLGGTNNDGTVFEISSNGVITTLYQFDRRVDGKNPQAALVLASDGNFYGTTRGANSTGGKNDDGTAFVMSSAGTLNTIHQFNGGGQFNGGAQFGGGTQSGGPE
ncbi:MAG TPA: choice-of-anchor tandem repeat GloVer-containing protein, partial [Verrucomicrobiae bacterium]|nr:choice-of-anchor tandem repeat GloVer-containing protein [Verrucomicrobiae bacterium]